MSTFFLKASTWCLLLSFCVAACESSSSWSPVSMAQLVNSPDRYVGRSVEVVGVVGSFNLESWLFLSGEHARARDLSSGFVLLKTADGRAFIELNECNSGLVRVFGKFVQPESHIYALSEIERVMRYDSSGRDALDCYSNY